MTWFGDLSIYRSLLLLLLFILGVSNLRRVLIMVTVCMRQWTNYDVSPLAESTYAPFVSVVIPAFNEEKNIEQTIQMVLTSSYQNFEVIVVDDGSEDNTSFIVKNAFIGNQRLKVLTKDNGGKATALNYGINHAQGEIIIALDADTLFTQETIARLVRHFETPNIGAVAGNLLVGNASNIITHCQAIEYVIDQNFERYAHDQLHCINVVPGAVGAWRKNALVAAGGYSSDTLTEDADLTWTIQELGWRVRNERTALAFTEAPHTIEAFLRQRYRWTFGTLQTMLKHRKTLFKNSTLGWIAFPGIISQILACIVTPCVDIIVIITLFVNGPDRIVSVYFAMIILDFVLALFGYFLIQAKCINLLWIVPQRLLYRPVMIYVILKSLWSILVRHEVKWNKLERRGDSRIDDVLVNSVISSNPLPVLLND